MTTALAPCSLALLHAALAGRDALVRAAAPLAVAPGWPHPDLADALPLIAAAVEASPTLAQLQFVIVADNTIIGDIGCKYPPRAGVVEVGYGLARSHRGQGHATRALAQLITHLAARPDVTTITAECALDNAPSIRLLQRAGFREVSRDHEYIDWERSLS